MKNIPESWQLCSTEDLTDIHSKGYILRHKKSGARAAVIENDDENKVFYIGFRTPVSDSTGVPHIIEHTVLNGSEKYPAKDPFVELVKGSINTFLNAMTYPDKTVFPVASTNEKDFKNLMDVYMDAVLHPNIYRHEEIFRQEGWHYELPDPEGDLTINGVVYNEMKGAFSSPDDVLERQVMNSLFPDTTYHYESGGDPEVIPTLTYEDFLNFHRRFYHPCNSYIYLYGDCDMAERLDYLDREYLSRYEAIDLDSEIELQKPFSAPVTVKKEYPVAADDSVEGKTYVALTRVVGDTEDPITYSAFDILDQVLLNTPGAPLRKALQEAGIATDIMGGFDSSIRQTTFSVELKGSDEKYVDRFLSIVKEVLTEQVEKGIDKKALESAINVSEFKFREADYGTFPKGLIWGLGLLDSWLYDDARPFIHLYGIQTYAKLRELAQTDYFENLIRKYLLENNHASLVTLVPHPGLTGERDAALKASLAEKKASLSAAEIDEIISEAKELKAYQSEEDSPEILEKIPMLSRSDLRRKISPFHNTPVTAGDTTVVHHDVNTNGISYLSLMFDVSDIGLDRLPALAFLSKIMGLTDTADTAYPEFAKEVFLHTGGIDTLVKTCNTNERDFRIFYVVRSKFLYSEFDRALQLMEEMMLKPDFSDTARLNELIKQEYSGCQDQFMSSGNAVARLRIRAQYSKRGRVGDAISGIAYYRYIRHIFENFDTEGEKLAAEMKALAGMLFSRKRLLVSATCGKEELSEVVGRIPALAAKLPETEPDWQGMDFAPVRNNEGFCTASQIQYVARGGSFLDAGYSYTGAMEIVKTILSYDYFWQNIRVRGGAYGCSGIFSRGGDVSFSSYRDPHLTRTKDVFEKTADYLEHFDVSERDMTKYVIGTMGLIDTPRTPAQEGIRSMTHYLSDLSDEDIQKTRDQILDASPADIRAIAAPVRAAMDQNYFCVIGNEEKIKAAGDLFDSVENLL